MRALRIQPISVLGLLIAVFLAAGFWGLDFGSYWDEPFQQELISRPYQTGVFLPGSYNYGSVVFDIASVLLAPEGIRFVLKSAKEAKPYYDEPYEKIVPPEKADQMVQFVYSKPFLMRMRTVFVCITALTGVWMYLAVRACKRSGWEAVCGAAVVLTSWEVAYHARWVAADTVQMQFAALWLVLFALAAHSQTSAVKWLRWAAAVAGLACSTKYQGGILLIPVLAYTLIVVRREYSDVRLRPMMRELAIQVGVFLAAFLVATPGAVFQPIHFIQSLRAVSEVYVSGHGGYTVGPFREHAYLLLIYLAAVMGSHWAPLAIIIAVSAAAGAVVLWRDQPIVGALLLFVPVAYLLYVICFRVMIVRNYLLVVPFLALFAARGAYWLWNVVSARPVWRAAAVAIFVAVFISNGAFLLYAAQTVHKRESTPFAADIVAHLKRHPTSHYLSPKVAALLPAGAGVESNVTKDPAAAERCVLFPDEVSAEDWKNKWICNRLGQYQLISGPIEVNFDYYSSWTGAPMIVELSMARARQMHLLPGL